MQIALEQLISGKLPYILVGRDKLPDRVILLPGSFNPLHCGHEALLRVAEKKTGREGVFELSVSNVDKPPLAIDEVERRLLPLQDIRPVVLTSSPTFAEKIELFPGAWFALGYDTAVRLLDSAYHTDVSAMLARFQTLGTRFVVGGRAQGDDFLTLENLPIPAEFEELFIPIPESAFREDISSAELRTR
jgi:glycerol-3-phosphate cytidylyltransferase-like family protein